MPKLSVFDALENYFFSFLTEQEGNLKGRKGAEPPNKLLVLPV